MEKKKSKQLFFLVAVPRSGNTMFASVMNQNPEIACTANSITLEIMKNLCTLKEDEVFKNYPDHKSLDNVIDSVYDNYYKDWPQKYIIDRGPVTLTDNFLALQKHFKRPFKIIILWRDLMDVLASYMQWYKNNPDAFPNKIEGGDIEKLTRLMHAKGAVATGLTAVQNALNPKNKHLCHLIKYDEFVINPENHLKELYKFLEIPYYQHYFENLKQININGVSYDDTFHGSNMHKVQPGKIRKIYNPYIEQIPKIIKDQYGHITL